MSSSGLTVGQGNQVNEREEQMTQPQKSARESEKQEEGESHFQAIESHETRTGKGTSSD